MKPQLFKKKYEGIKMHKYVPLLEKEIGKRINQKNDWMEAALEINERASKLKLDIATLMFLLFIIGGVLLIEVIISIMIILGG